jgi:hypothetical protein
VTLHIGVESIGPLQHRAIVETNHPTAPAVEFWTLATVQPRVRLEAVAETAAPLLPNATARRTFEIFAYGTPAEPPPVLDEAQVRSGLEAVWDGPARERVLDHGLIERSRSLVVLLKGAGKAGQRADELEIVEGGRTLLTYPLHWEVLEAVKAVPAGFVVAGSSEREEKQVLLQTQDGRAFQITGIESGLAGVEAEAALRTPKQRHLVRIRALPGPENRGRSGDLIIATDHPAQQVIKVAVFVTGTEPGPGR